jgi:predicted nucleic acid-binding protein
MYLLDTNVVSLLDRRRRETAPALVDWIGRNGDRLFLSAMTIAELEAGVLKLLRRKQDKRAAEVAALVDRIELYFTDRILPMDRHVARMIARLEDQIIPEVLELADLIIAATASVHQHVILTRNLRHFTPTGVPALDPVAELPPDPH